MTFQTTKANIQQLLSDNANGKYEVIGYQRDLTNPDEHLLPSVYVYFSEESFDKSGSSISGGAKGEVKINIDIIVSENSPGQPDLENRKNAEMRADAKLDTLFSQIWGIIMDQRNVNLGHAEGEISERFINRFQKGSPRTQGTYTVLKGNCDITFTAFDMPASDQGNDGEIISGTLESDQGLGYDARADSSPAVLENA